VERELGGGTKVVSIYRSHPGTVLAPKAHQIGAKAPSDWRQRSPPLLYTPRATWTISVAGPTCKGYQMAENKQNMNGMTCKAKKFRAVAPICGQLF
jgi:hypothetical protein